jgi:hypothetical protein
MVQGKLNVHMKKIQTKPHHLKYTQINSKWIKHLSAKPEVVKVQEENIGETLVWERYFGA